MKNKRMWIKLDSSRRICTTFVLRKGGALPPLNLQNYGFLLRSFADCIEPLRYEESSTGTTALIISQRKKPAGGMMWKCTSTARFISRVIPQKY